MPARDISTEGRRCNVNCYCYLCVTRNTLTENCNCTRRRTHRSVPLSVLYSREYFPPVLRVIVFENAPPRPWSRKAERRDVTVIAAVFLQFTRAPVPRATIHSDTVIFRVLPNTRNTPEDREPRAVISKTLAGHRTSLAQCHSRSRYRPLRTVLLSRIIGIPTGAARQTSPYSASLASLAISLGTELRPERSSRIRTRNNAAPRRAWNPSRSFYVFWKPRTFTKP